MKPPPHPTQDTWKTNGLLQHLWETLQFARVTRVGLAAAIYNYRLLKDVIGSAWHSSERKKSRRLTKHPKKTLHSKQKHSLLQNPSNPFVVKHSVAEQNPEKFQSKSSQKKVGPDWCQGHQSVRRDPLDFGAWRITEAADTPGEKKVNTTWVGIGAKGSNWQKKTPYESRDPQM